MAKKGKCSSASSTPQRDNLKKAKTESDLNNNSTRKSTRLSTIKNQDLNNTSILNGNSKSVNTRKQPVKANKRSNQNKESKQNKKVKKSTDSSIENNDLNEKTDNQIDNQSDNSLEIEQDLDKIKNEDQQLDKNENQNSNKNKDQELDKSEDSNKSKLDLSADESSDDDQVNKPKNKINNHSNKNNIKTNGHLKKEKKSNVKSVKKSTKKDLSDGESCSEQEEKKINRNEVLTQSRRSARKRTSRFNLKELVSSGEEDESDYEDNKGKKNKISKKLKRQSVREFIGSSDEDEYKPGKESEQSEEEEEDIDEKISDEEESDIQSDEEPTKSKYFKRSNNTSTKSKYFNRSNKSTSQSISYKPSSFATKSKNINIDLSKTSAPKSGGCTFNSIGIDTLGKPQQELLKQKIANYQIPAWQAVPASNSKLINNQQESQFGNGSCVRELLKQSHVYKSYEKYKKQHIKKVKNKEDVKKEDLTDILKEFENNIANPQNCSADSSKATNDSDDDTDDDDFEEVENAEIEDDFDDGYKPECLDKGVTIQVKNSFKPNQRNPKKNYDWIYDAIRLGINRQRKEIFKDATKVSFIVNLARVKYLNNLTFDQEIQALAYSTDFLSNFKATKQINETFVHKFMSKFKETFQFAYSKDKSQLVTNKEAIRKAFETSKTEHPTIYNLIFLILFRTYCQLNSIKENSRLCIAFRPIDSKCTDLINKPKKKAAAVILDGDLDSDEEEEKPKKSKAKKPTGGKKKGGKAASKKKAKKESDIEDEELSDEEMPIKQAKNSKTSKKSADEEKPIKLQLNKKNLIELWLEIYLPDKNEWRCFEPINEAYYAEDLEKHFYCNPLYILSFNSNNNLKDLTSKYISTYYLHKFKSLRLEDEYLESVYAAYRTTEPTKDELDEDEKIREFHLDKPLPKSISEYKNHGLYFLERHLLKYQVIYPLDAPVVGKVNGKEKVYLREDVHETHSKEYWKKEARQVKDGEEPAKVSTARPKWDKNRGDYIKNLPLNLYGHWQTEEWNPGDVIDGKIPRNSFGNIDLFKPCMLPRGASYLRLNGLLKIAQKLNIDCAPAITSFDIKKGATIPVADGFVVPTEYEEILTIAWQEEQVKQIEKAEEKYYKRVYGNWRRLIKGVLIRNKIKKKYRDGIDDDEGF